MPIKCTQAEIEAMVTISPSVPPGHRTKCRSCGAVDNTVIKGHDRRIVRCGACGSTVARRRAPRKPKIISFVVCRQLNGESYGDVPCVDLFTAEREAISFVDHGTPGRVRIAQIVELLDNERTGNVRTLRYDNFRQRRSQSSWVSGCVACKGRGLIAVRVPVKDGSVIRFLPCVACNSLGGELTRRVMFGKAKHNGRR